MHHKVAAIAPGTNVAHQKYDEASNDDNNIKIDEDGYLNFDVEWSSSNLFKPLIAEHSRQSVDKNIAYHLLNFKRKHKNSWTRLKHRFNNNDNILLYMNKNIKFVNNFNLDTTLENSFKVTNPH